MADRGNPDTATPDAKQRTTKWTSASTSLDALEQVLALFPPDSPDGDGIAMYESGPVRDSWVRYWRRVARDARERGGAS